MTAAETPPIHRQELYRRHPVLATGGAPILIFHISFMKKNSYLVYEKEIV
jgi:hypothetical protein